MNGMIETKLKRMGLALAALAGGLIGSGMAAHAQDKVGFATNWKAQGSQGGFYQAIADGTYKKYGLDVEIVQGGPQVNTRALLPAGKVDFLLSPSPQNALENNRAKIPTTIVAAFFQKDPQALMAHPGRYKTLGDMKAAPMVFIGKPAQFTWWPWLKLKFGFSDDQVKPYNYTLAPFLTKTDSVQQAYATAEALYVDTFKPDVFMLADYGWTAYSNIIETRSELVQDNPDLVQRFVDASIIGWNNYLYGDRKQAYALIREDNPEMTEDKLEAEVAEIQRRGLADTGDAVDKGLGAIDLKRLAGFHDEMVEVGLYKPGEIDLKTAVTDQFVNKGVGLEVRKRLETK
ncbi:ABC transporter substrate-binding protein [Aminobacter sp. AP02]|uniref:ABC transporter substrate-binding protein n=1 Tax=Aminobacter sp. AP02 TaxID=2135737 RepID=UPI000D7A5F35|nr:ABC transporter substrate-binding protein [Aminobacter sp. AP02]PWK65676.1 NitT/TauT family transport system substrate-binding protein [Aminobacter sp. AP02]